MNVELPNEDHFFSFAESALHYVTRQDSLLIKAPATNIIKTSWDLFFFLHSDLRTLFSQSDWTIFLVKKSHASNFKARSLHIWIEQRSLHLTDNTTKSVGVFIDSMFSAVTFKVFVPWWTQVIQVFLLNLILRRSVTVATFWKASLSFQTNVFKLHLHVIDGTRVTLYPQPPENFKNQSCCNFSILLPHWILEIC